jgi:hypothetical protein
LTKVAASKRSLLSFEAAADLEIIPAEGRAEVVVAFEA